MPILKPSRRDLLRLAALAPGFVLPALRPASALGAPETDNPAHFRFSLGEANLTVISDGYLALPASGLGVNADPEDVRRFLEQHFLSPETQYSHTNHLLIELGKARVLVDLGSGNRFLPTAGRLFANLENAGIDPSSITHVVVTHAHPDHIWGIRDDFDEPILPDAEYIMGRAEHDFWTEDGLVSRVPDEMQQFVVGAVNSIQAEGLQWALADEGHKIAPGISMLSSPGHTPGHMSIHVASGGEELIALGDAMTHAHMNFAHPDWVNGFDMDGDQTVATRLALLDRAAADRVTILGYHFPFPGVGHVTRDGDAFRFLPALWRFTE
ncbi:Glyoxylase, beta-lactamase superfamily II [Poseidonocella pacifica]|uniref:Glyoxylase, beta-lactamase superfamily II n=1 Tax=Poseidonocella pacifica TaxID=871651 RepID=A0A1I0XYN7_9RHOB|nr:MBL fold metallo-hydrolase [Poseidonocella pacifica]SFB06239.1 Glyoxylase, beta-lactamase superfamily II [Poseidonocella pacifica]